MRGQHAVAGRRPRCVTPAGMERYCSRGPREDQPAVAGIDGTEAEHVAEKSAVGVRVGAVDDDVRTDDHARSAGQRLKIDLASITCTPLVTSTTCVTRRSAATEQST